MTTLATAQAKKQREGNQAVHAMSSQGVKAGEGLGADVVSLQRRVGNNTVNNLIDSLGRDTNQSQRKLAQGNSLIDSMPLDEAIKNIPNIPPDQALLVLKRYQQFIIRRITTGEGRIRDAQSLRAESFSNYLIGGTIEAFGGTSLPSDNWIEPWQRINAAYNTLSKRQAKESLVILNTAAEATNQHWEQLNTYLDQTEKGADRSIFALQALQAAGAVAATALTGGGATAIVVGAGYGAAQNVVGQATAVSIGIQSEIDWAGVAFDTLFGLVTGKLGGSLGNKVLKKLMGDPKVASLGRRVASEVVSDLVSGRLSSILQTTARSLFDQLRGKKNLTVEQFLELLADQLLDPKAMLLDAIMGRAFKIAHRPSSKIPEKVLTKSRATITEPTAKSTVHPAVEPTTAKLPIESVHTAEPVLTKAIESAAPEVPVAKPIEPVPLKPVEAATTPEPLSHKAGSPEIGHPAPAKDTTLLRELSPTPVVQESTPSSRTKEASIHPSSDPLRDSGLELDLSGNREGWNKHIDEYQIVETAKVSAEAKTAERAAARKTSELPLPSGAKAMVGDVSKTDKIPAPSLTATDEAAAMHKEIDTAFDKLGAGKGKGGTTGKFDPAKDPYAGPGVRVPIDKEGNPAKVLDVGAGSKPTDLGLPPEFDLVAIERSDINKSVHIDHVFDATKTPPLALLGKMDALVINNPRGYTPNIEELGKALQPNGRIIVQGRARIGLASLKNTKGFNPNFQALVDNPAPTGFKKIIEIDEGGLPPSPANTSADILGGPFYKTEGDQRVWPNARVIFVKSIINQ